MKVPLVLAALLAAAPALASDVDRVPYGYVSHVMREARSAPGHNAAAAARTTLSNQPQIPVTASVHGKAGRKAAPRDDAVVVTEPDPGAATRGTALHVPGAASR